MAVASSSFQPSRIGFGSIFGAPLPAGRIEKDSLAAAGGAGAPDAAQHGAADHASALLQAAQPHLRRVQPDRA